MIRQRGIILLALTIAVMGVGLMLWSFQKDYRQQDQLADQQRRQLVVACNARNVQSHDSQKLLRRIAGAEEAENQDSASFLRDLANKTTNPELRTVLLRQAVLELDRDKSVADIFLELANNIKFPDCANAAGDQ